MTANQRLVRVSQPGSSADWLLFDGATPLFLLRSLTSAPNMAGVRALGVLSRLSTRKYTLISGRLSVIFALKDARGEENRGG